MALTQHKEGSLRELVAVSFPLMIATLSTVMMLFVDRLFLAHYSQNALNAAVTASTIGMAFNYTLMAIAGIAEVYVSQYNGAERYEDLGRPVWQMIWFSLMTPILCIPLALWGGDLLFFESPLFEKEVAYFSWFVLFGPSFAIYAALAAFFIGQGKTALITWLSILANFLNATLDFVLIFGIEGFIPSLGIRGAVIGTCLGQVFQAAILAILFLRKSNRQKKGSLKWKFDTSLFRKCLRVGSPPALFYGIEIFGWGIFYEMMTSLSDDHITVSGICQSLFILFSFFGDSISKGASVIAGNFIGANNSKQVKKVLFSGTRLHFLFFCFMALSLVIFPEALIALFISDLSSTTLASLKTGFICLLFYCFFEGLRWLISGLLTAAGDTLFLLIAGSLFVWLFLIAPVYFFVVRLNGTVEMAWAIAVVYSALGLAAYLVRFYSGKWKKIHLIKT